MKLGLCSGVAPEASLDELLDAAQRRGLSVLELREGDGHGVSPARPLRAAAAAERAGNRRVRLSGYRVTSYANPPSLVAMGKLLGAPILFDGASEAGLRRAHATRAATEGARAAFVIRGPKLLDEARRAFDAGLDLAWDVDPSSDELTKTVSALLAEFGDRLTHVRLHGGGPEANLQDGRGIGELTSRLALAGYGGTFILTPTTPRYRIAWRNWLGRGGGWGCGGKSGDRELVTLSASGSEAGAPR